MKDLTNSTDLDQIRWIFNGSKNPVGNAGESFRDAMLAEINKLPLTNSLAEKLLPGIADPTAIKLRQEIVEQFDEIFDLVD